MSFCGEKDGPDKGLFLWLIYISIERKEFSDRLRTVGSQLKGRNVGTIVVPHSDVWTYEELLSHMATDPHYGECDEAFQVMLLSRDELRRLPEPGGAGVGVFSREYMRLQQRHEAANVLLSNGQLVRHRVPVGFSKLPSIWIYDTSHSFSAIASPIKARLRQMRQPTDTSLMRRIPMFKSESF